MTHRTAQFEDDFGGGFGEDMGIPQVNTFEAYWYLLKSGLLRTIVGKQGPLGDIAWTTETRARNSESNWNRYQIGPPAEFLHDVNSELERVMQSYANKPEVYRRALDIVNRANGVGETPEEEWNIERFRE